MKIAFYGGQTSGIIALLTLLADKQIVDLVFPEDAELEKIAKLFRLNLKDKFLLKNLKFVEQLKKRVDILICCHGRLILPKELVSQVKCINLHPCLYKYKGAHPIKRLIADRNPQASVASHWMVEKVDEGETIDEEYKIIDDIETKSEAGVYNKLYPLYSEVLIKTLKKIHV